MRKSVGIAAFAAFALAATPVVAQNISIATGGTGGVYYPLGGGLAALLSKKIPGMQATADLGQVPQVVRERTIGAS